MFTESETLSVINKLKNKSSSGIDEISNKLLKSIKHEICPALTLIINQSLTTGIVPDEFKISKVIPLYKKGDKSCINNYRPISLLPTFSKVFERILYTQLYTYLNENNLICEQQYGFRSKHSTELATIKLVDKLINEMDNMNTPIAIFLDLSKAFDTLDFNILLEKLKFYGIIGIPLLLINNYLTGRYQYVKYNNYKSNLSEIKTGIPQGSILGPLFFSIYINDLVQCSNTFKFLLYADDTTLYFNLEDFHTNNKTAAINEELEKINNWLNVNKLTLNVDKTTCMHFAKRRTLEPLSFEINNKTITNVSQFKFLGVVLDSHISWKNHIDMVTIKLSKIIGILHRLKHIFPRYILITIYNSLFMPNVNFGLLLWGTSLDPIIKKQKKAVRAITHSNYNAHSEPLLKELHLLKVQDIFSTRILQFMHKLAHGTLPQYFDNYLPYLQKLATPYSLRPHPLPLPPVHHVYAESCLIYQVVKMQNKTDHMIIDKLTHKTHSLYGFTKYVKLKLLNAYSFECNLLFCISCRP